MIDFTYNSNFRMSIRLGLCALLTLILILPLFAFADFPIKGIVTDSNGEALVGVSVNEKGTTNATSTDGKGQFTITVKDGNSTLLFTYIGFTAKELAINNQ